MFASLFCYRNISRGGTHGSKFSVNCTKETHKLQEIITNLQDLSGILLDSGGIRVFGGGELNELCKDLPAVPRCRAEARAHRAARLPALLLPHRARAGVGEHRGIHAGARG